MSTPINTLPGEGEQPAQPAEGAPAGTFPPDSQQVQYANMALQPPVQHAAYGQPQWGGMGWGGGMSMGLGGWGNTQQPMPPLQHPPMPAGGAPNAMAPGLQQPNPMQNMQAPPMAPHSQYPGYNTLSAHEYATAVSPLLLHS